IDLAKAYMATQYIDRTLGTDSPMGGTQFEALSGAVRLALRKDGERQVTFTAGVTKPIHVATKNPTATAVSAPGPDVEIAATDRQNGAAAAAANAVAPTTTCGGGLAVGPGTLKISSNKVAEPVTVPAGKCLTGNDMPAVGAHPLLGALSVVDCP